jgi:hypothetical protein
MPVINVIIFITATIMYMDKKYDIIKMFFGVKNEK